MVYSNRDVGETLKMLMMTTRKGNQYGRAVVMLRHAFLRTSG
jgi:hypothetical protein